MDRTGSVGVERRNTTSRFQFVPRIVIFNRNSTAQGGGRFVGQRHAYLVLFYNALFVIGLLPDWLTIYSAQTDYTGFLLGPIGGSHDSA